MLGDVQYHCIDHCGVRNDTPVDLFLRPLHLGADVVDQLWVFCFEVVVKLVFKVVDAEVNFKIRQDSRVLHIVHRVHFEILAERIWGRDILWDGSQDHILKLDGMVWEGIYKVEVKITKEFWVVLENYQNNSDRGSVKGLHRWGCLLAYNHVLFQELKALNNQVFN